MRPGYRRGCARAVRGTQVRVRDARRSRRAARAPFGSCRSVGRRVPVAPQSRPGSLARGLCSAPAGPWRKRGGQPATRPGRKSELSQAMGIAGGGPRAVDSAAAATDDPPATKQPGACERAALHGHSMRTPMRVLLPFASFRGIAPDAPTARLLFAVFDFRGESPEFFLTSEPDTTVPKSRPPRTIMIPPPLMPNDMAKLLPNG